jgi:glucokinase
VELGHQLHLVETRILQERTLDSEQKKFQLGSSTPFLVIQAQRDLATAGPHMAQWAREQGWDAPAEADAKELADAANAGDPVALRAFRRGAGAVAAMIASVGAVCDLDLVVVGGGVAKSGALLFDPLREALAVHARLAFLRDLRVVPAELGGDAGLVGAAALLDSAHS